jgi:hypothetical protein
MLIDKLVIMKQVLDGVTPEDYGSKKSMIEELSIKYGLRTGLKSSEKALGIKTEIKTEKNSLTKVS